MSLHLVSTVDQALLLLMMFLNIASKSLSLYYGHACFRHCYRLKWGYLCYFKPYLLGWRSDIQCVHGYRNPGDSSDPVCVVTLLLQRQESLAQAGPLRFSLIETWHLEWIPEENGVVGVESHWWQPSRLKGHDKFWGTRLPWVSYLGCSAFPLIL